MTRIYTADEARTLRENAGLPMLETAIGRTYGSDPSVEHFVRIPEADFSVAAEVCGPDGMPSEAAAKLFAAAPGLTETVERLTADLHHAEERAAMHAAEGVRLGERYAAANALAVRAVDELEQLRAIIEGRTVPPTDEEIEAHEAAGGRWRCVVPMALHLCADAMHGHAARMHRDCLIAAGHDSLWWATDGRARHGPWPAVAPRVPR